MVTKANIPPWTLRPAMLQSGIRLVARWTRIQRFGLSLTRFLIENISVPPEVEKMLDTRSRMVSWGPGKYMQFQTAEAIPEAAAAGGSAGSAMGLEQESPWAADDGRNGRKYGPGTAESSPADHWHWTASSVTRWSQVLSRLWQQRSIPVLSSARNAEVRRSPAAQNAEWPHLPMPSSARNAARRSGDTWSGVLTPRLGLLTKWLGISWIRDAG